MPIELTPVETRNQEMARRSRETPSVWRWCVAYWSKDSQSWTLAAPAAQGRFTSATKEEAETHLSQMIENNSADRLQQLYGGAGNMTVKPIECWPNHFDPRNVWLDGPPP